MWPPTSAAWMPSATLLALDRRFNRAAQAGLSWYEGMIVSHHHRFIFAAIPKTGTHSVRQALREHLGDEDIEQVGMFVKKRFPYEDLAKVRHGHLSLTQVRPYLGEDVFGSYFKFAFVRNPFARFVSYCAFMTRADGAFEINPHMVMEHVLFREPPDSHILFHPQYTVLVDAEGRLLTDEIGRVENMQEHYDRICSRIGIPTELRTRARQQFQARRLSAVLHAASGRSSRNPLRARPGFVRIRVLRCIPTPARPLPSIASVT